jgi:cytochrome c oxidase assembly protein subunit 15
VQDGTGSVGEAAAARDARYASNLARGFGALLGLTWGLITLGALVRAHGAGLACPDWPLCFGELVPRFDFHVAFEVGHRYLAGSVSALFLGLAALALLRPRTRRAVGGLLTVGLGLLGLQVVLGGLTVLRGLASWTVTAHLVTGNAFAATLLLVARGLGEASRPRTPRRALPPGLRPALAAAGALLVLQVVLGGLVSSNYAGLACPDWPACRAGVWLPSLSGPVGLHLAHRWNAVLLLAALAAAAAAARKDPTLARVTGGALLLGLLQLALGVANVLLRVPVEITALHSAVGAGLVLTLTWGLREAWRRPVSRREALAAPGLASAR